MLYSLEQKVLEQKVLESYKKDYNSNNEDILNDLISKVSTFKNLNRKLSTFFIGIALKLYNIDLLPISVNNYTIQDLTICKKLHAVKIINNINSSSEKILILKLLYEYTILAYYLGEINYGRVVSDIILFTPKIEHYIRENITKNLFFYLRKISIKKYKEIIFETPLIFEDEHPINISWKNDHFYPLNPSIIKIDSGYFMICRTVNYTQSKTNVYTIKNNKRHIITRNFSLLLDDDLNILSKDELLDKSERIRYPHHIVGQEDCRLFKFNNRIWFTCTTIDTQPHFCPKISLCLLSRDLKSIESLTLLESPSPGRCEKNWLPFVTKDGNLNILYSSEPTIIFKPTFSTRTNQENKTNELNQITPNGTEDDNMVNVQIPTGNCPVISNQNNEGIFCNFRGSAPPIPYDRNNIQGYLYIIHEVEVNNFRFYYHRFVWMDLNYKIREISEPFYFFELGIEYCSSLTLSKNGDEFILGVGIKDQQAFLISIDKILVDKLLISVF